MINLLSEGAVPDLIGPAEAGTGSRAQYTIWVEDVDAVADELAGKEIALVNGPQDRPWGQRTLLFADPDGHLWEYAQEIG